MSINDSTKEEVTRGDVALAGKNMSKKLPIQQAKAFYLASSVALHQQFEDLVVELTSEKPGGMIDNNDYFHALWYTDIMFGQTRNSIRMLTGNEASGFLKALAHVFEAALKQITKNRGLVRIIMLAEQPPPFLRDLKDKYRSVFDVKLARLIPGQQIEHTIICDDYMVRKEAPHEPLTELSDAGEVKAKVYFDNEGLAEVETASFDGLWEKLRPSKQVTDGA